MYLHFIYHIAAAVMLICFFRSFSFGDEFQYIGTEEDGEKSMLSVQIESITFHLARISYAWRIFLSIFFSSNLHEIAKDVLHHRAMFFSFCSKQKSCMQIKMRRNKIRF